jgi:dihydroflavonol-4-reductase
MHALVTGANGHLGYNLTRELLARGDKVRASVRSLADAMKAGPLRALGKIEMIEVDVFRPDQFRAALEGIDVFFHLAASYAYVIDRGREEEQVIRPSIDGATNAIRAAAEARVPKVVMTSSAVTLPLTRPGAPPSTEENWTDDLRVPYFRAKVLAERKAWELAKALKVNLVTVLPGAICGPGFARGTPSTDLIECIMLGYFRTGIPNLNFPYVDVRDVVSAHVLAAEKECSGRFIACNDHLPSLLELNERMHAIDPSVPRALMMLPDFMLAVAPLFDRLNHRLLDTPRSVSFEYLATTKGKIYNASNQRIKRELGWTQSAPLEVSLKDTMEQIRLNRAKRAA